MEKYLIANTLSYPILSTIMLIPVIGALITLFLKNDTVLKAWGLIVTIATLVVSYPLYTAFDSSTAKYQFAEVRTWFPSLNLDYVIGVDGISVLLVLLTTFVMPLCILCSWKYIQVRMKEFIFVSLLMETAMIGVFVSLNTVLFYIFWEGMLVPMYLMIAVWGGARKDYASIKFFLYTFVGSIFLLVAVIALYVTTGTFFIPELMDHQYSYMYQMLVFLSFALSFAIKMPMYPVHTWLPAAHVEAPTAGSVILASILLKMGGYGFLRFCLPLAPSATLDMVPWVIGFSVLGIIIGGYLALAQQDIKKLIAYSSVAHMGFVTLGIFLLNSVGIKGAMLQMINHGITTGALFICVGLIYERTHSRQISDNSALGMEMPIYVTFLVIFGLSSFGFPGTNSFVSEFMVLIAAFEKYPVVGGLSILGAIMAAAYMLNLLQKMVWANSDGHAHGHGDHGDAHGDAHGAHGDAHGDHGHARHLWDCNLREIGTLSFLLFFVFWVGFNPKPLLNMMDTSVNHLLQQVETGSKAPTAKTEKLQVSQLVAK
ncbi:NADH-quinone oxidoreductase subunit M [Geomonas sp. RF6]|uniref:complex I subunit 4 family protein n=1 Tax=Geomonas sp. RF6 TaxID=2897342 RepID=UPI001E507B0C|nr:NADH-quinone oxidoreductase subunit M [Geomonas sp. RF6]UFS69790.1 NADH-quinone oxidoreductase subunit M [Geomonas sp. RF6]